jgi:hypothetical protein
MEAFFVAFSLGFTKKFARESGKEIIASPTGLFHLCFVVSRPHHSPSGQVKTLSGVVTTQIGPVLPGLILFMTSCKLFTDEKPKA